MFLGTSPSGRHVGSLVGHATFMVLVRRELLTSPLSTCSSGSLRTSDSICGGLSLRHMMPLLLALSEKKFPVEAVASIGRL